MKKAKAGVIYILTNPSFPGYVKIGFASDIDKRLMQLNKSECIPFAFRVYATYEVNSPLQDKELHNLIDRINPDLRATDIIDGKRRCKEFYAMSPEDAYAILESIAKLSGTTQKLRLHFSGCDCLQSVETKAMQGFDAQRIDGFDYPMQSAQWFSCHGKMLIET